MKRSEAIRQIRTNIYFLQDSESIAETALEIMEELGMLPPDNGKEAYDVLDYRSKCLKWDEE